MKSMHKGVVGLLVLAAAGLTVWSAAGRQQEAAAVEQASSGVEQAPSAVAPAATQAAEVPAADSAPPAASDGEPVAAPADLKVTVRDSKQGKVLLMRRTGHLVALRRGDERRVTGMHEVVVPAVQGGELVWETTSEKTLETLRGRVIVGDDGKVAFENTVRAAVLSQEARAAHLCRGHADGAGGFVVLCRVDGPAAAASVDGNDPKQGVWSLAGERTMVRFDLPMSGDGASARVLGYEKGGQGVLVRVEASRAPGEAAAVLALGSDSRAQPEPVRPGGCFSCRLPPRDDLL